MTSPNDAKVIIQGFAFEDNIIAMSLTTKNGEVTSHFGLQHKLMDSDVSYYGLSTFAYVRDKNSGQQDNPLQDEDGTPKYMFLSINVHNFTSPQEAHSAVVTQCRQLYEVRQKFPNKTICKPPSLTFYVFLNFKGCNTNWTKRTSLYI